MNQLIGHFHPLVVHLPIGILLLAILFTFLSQKERFQGLKVAVPISFLLGAMSAAISCITGYLLFTNGEYEGEIVQNHQWLGIGVAVLSFYAYFMTRSSSDKNYSLFTKMSIGALALLLTLTGHLGGTLTHGADYLFTIKSNLTQQPEKGKSNTPPQYSDNSIVYQDIIQPILKEKCANCHNESKQKGKLRLDKAEFLQKGGEHGAVFVASKPDESKMVQRLFLPLEHKEHMPPKEKLQLTEEEKKIVRWWIEQGGDFRRTVKDYPDFKAIVTKNSSIATPPVSYIPEAKIEQPDKEAIEALQKMNIVALPIGKDNPFLSVNFINNANLNAAKPYIQKLSKNIIWLKMADSTVTDSSLMILAGMANLTKLYLDRTQVTNTGLQLLLSLKNLVFLNLTGTKVTKEGVLSLTKLPKLKRLFLYQTAVKTEDLAFLQTQLPTVQIDFGHYQVPTLYSDTTLVMPPAAKK
jgi:uncharacterized membrane protein